ncbi:hypothetical protein LINPERPRIM_LOCUS3818 [Linum perenne]
MRLTNYRKVHLKSQQTQTSSIGLHVQVVRIQWFTLLHSASSLHLQNVGIVSG